MIFHTSKFVFLISFLICNFVVLGESTKFHNTTDFKNLNCLENVLANLLKTSGNFIIEKDETFSFSNSLHSKSSQARSLEAKTKIATESCAAKVQGNCNPFEPYRTLNGECNNLQSSSWGSSKHPFRRILPAEFSQSDSSSIGGGPRGGDPTTLPEPRILRTTMHEDQDQLDPELTTMTMTFGHFLAHDLTQAFDHPFDKLPNCCPPANVPLSENCFPIKIPLNDTFYSGHGVNCKNFSRTGRFCIDNREIRQQRNFQTSFIDGSPIYSIDANSSAILRTEINGLLRTNENNFPPDLKNDGTILAGDFRANNNPALAAMHIVWLREHNRIAKALFSRNPNLNDEEVFQKSRRILIAELQNIVYNEYLKLLFPSCIYEIFDLGIIESQSLYNSNINPTISAEMSGAAFRMGHSMINGRQLLVRDGEIVRAYNFRDAFLFPMKTITNNEILEQILEGLAYNPNQKVDRYVSDDVGNFLFKPLTLKYGDDLISRNIQRGRDHGVPAYTSVREFCGLPKIEFDSADNANIPDGIYSDAWIKMQKIYSSADEIDLLTGGLSEIPLNEGKLGSTFSCIIASEFYRLKFGDRFFFSHQNEVGNFERKQFENLRQRRLFDVICDNTEIKSLPPSVFHFPKESNSPISCESRNVLDFDLF